MLKSTNPVLTRMNDVENDHVVPGVNAMTVNGTIGKAFLLIIIAAIAGTAVFSQALAGYTDKVMGIMTISLFAGLIIGLLTAFMPKFAKFTAPIYAFCEGAVLTGFSLVLEAKFPGIAVQAISGTMLCFLVMLVLYRTGAVKATAKFRSTIMAAMTTILVLYLIDIVGGFFNFSIPFVSGFGPMSILFSAIVVLVASFSLILDFDFIEKGAQNLLHKDMEWYGAFGLLVTLVWLYVEVLKLIARLRDN